MANKITDSKRVLSELIDKGVITRVFPKREALEKALDSGHRPKIYLGADPTGEHLHLGHLTNLLILKRFQELGHEITFLIGDFTATIGDPTGKFSTRKKLTAAEVKKNMKSFQDQAAKIIRFSGENAAQVRKNSEWYGRMSIADFMEKAVGFFTVKNVLNRDMFRERLRGNRNNLDAISLKELIYPILQGYDGVALEIDMEIGGNDQFFNMSIGYALREADPNRAGKNFFITTALLVDPETGKKLMNKSEGGLINLDDAADDIFGKVMALSDASIAPVARLCAEMPLEQIKKIEKTLDSGANPRDSKLEVAEAVVKTIHGGDKAVAARNKFIEIFSKKEMPEDLPEIKITGGKISALDLVFSSGAVGSKSEARRLIEQGGLEVGGIKKKNSKESFNLRGGETVKIGKKKFFRAVLIEH